MEPCKLNVVDPHLTAFRGGGRQRFPTLRDLNWGGHSTFSGNFAILCPGILRISVVVVIPAAAVVTALLYSRDYRVPCRILAAVAGSLLSVDKVLIKTHLQVPTMDYTEVLYICLPRKSV